MAAILLAKVEKDSLAEKLGLEAGDKIININERKVTDLIQFQLEWAGEKVLLEIEKASGQHEAFIIEKDYDEPLGAVFEKAVFDGTRICRNKCVFCFVDQMPPGMRASLYQKDDDYRLSFLQGNYITLTNLQEEDLSRIKKEKLSPLYVSVHATDPAVREKMMAHPKAGYVLSLLKELAAEGISFHTQVVLCPGFNDGAVLERTYRELSELEGVLSLAVVPVGLTKYREKLHPLLTVDAERAAEVIAWVEPKQKECREKKGTSFIWLSDEFYLSAGKEIPSYQSYEDFCQLENGVGMTRLFWQEFEELDLPDAVAPQQEVVLVTGVSGEKVLGPVVAELNKIQGLKIELKPVANSFFGPDITVAGLLTGHCLLNGLQDIPSGSTVVIPSVLLKEQSDYFLDDLRIQDIEERLGINLLSVQARAAGIIELLESLKKVKS